MFFLSNRFISVSRLISFMDISVSCLCTLTRISRTVENSYGNSRYHSLFLILMEINPWFFSSVEWESWARWHSNRFWLLNSILQVLKVHYIPTFPSPKEVWGQFIFNYLNGSTFFLPKITLWLCRVWYNIKIHNSHSLFIYSFIFMYGLLVCIPPHPHPPSKFLDS